MLRERARLLQNLSVLLDGIVVSVAFAAAYEIKSSLPGGWGTIYSLAENAWLPMVGVPLWLLCLMLLGLYRSQRTTDPLVTVFRLGAAALLVGFVLSALMFTLKIGAGLSRMHLAFWAILSVSGLTLEKTAVQALLRRARRRGLNLKHILLVGGVEEATELNAMLEEHPEWGFRVIGRLSWSGEPETRMDGVTRLGSLDDMSRLLEDLSIDEVFLSLIPERWEDLQRAIALCEEVGVNVRIKPNLFGAALAKSYVDYMADEPVLMYTTTPTHPGALFLKQVFDYAAAVVLLVLLSPLLLLVAAAVRLSGPGPILFRQVRCGLNGRRFTLFKFRSMVDGAEGMRQALDPHNEVSGPVFKMREDPRVTPVGRVLRRTSMDELPQLINVLRGEMSLVGPRPPLPDEVERYERWQRRRLSMKPGITCLWQVHGRNHLDFEDWMRLDLQYIDNWSLLLDLRILLRTVGVVLLGRGAY